MRILIAGVNYAPELTGIAPFTTGLAEHLALQGHDVTVATTFPFAPHWRWFQAPPRWRTRERLNDVDVWRTKVILPKRRTTVERIIFDSSIGLTSGLAALSIAKVDVAVCVSPPIQTALVAAAIRFKLGKIVIFVQDLPTQAAHSVGMLREGLALRAGRYVEHLAYAFADHIVVISGSFASYMEGVGVRRAKISEIPNWADLDSIRPARPDQEMRYRLGAGPDDFLVVHSGNMGAKQDLANVAAAARFLEGHGRHIKIALIGDGQERRKLVEAIAGHQIDNIKLLPLQAPGEFSAVLNAADVLLVNQAPAVIDSVLPSKLLSYMASGRPIVAAVHSASATADLLRRAKCGVVTEPGQPAALAAALQSIVADKHSPGALDEMGMRGRAFAEANFGRQSVFERWDSLLTEIVPARAAQSQKMGHYDQQ